MFGTLAEWAHRGGLMQAVGIGEAAGQMMMACSPGQSQVTRNWFVQERHSHCRGKCTWFLVILSRPSPPSQSGESRAREGVRCTQDMQNVSPCDGGEWTYKKNEGGPSGHEGRLQMMPTRVVCEGKRRLR